MTLLVTLPASAQTPSPYAMAYFTTASASDSLPLRPDVSRSWRGLADLNGDGNPDVLYNVVREGEHGTAIDLSRCPYDGDGGACERVAAAVEESDLNRRGAGTLQVLPYHGRALILYAVPPDEGHAWRFTVWGIYPGENRMMRLGTFRRGVAWVGTTLPRVTFALSEEANSVVATFPRGQRETLQLPW